MRIKRSPETLAAIADIYAYTKEHWGTPQAGKYTQQLNNIFKKLAKDPSLGHTHPEVPPPYRVYQVGSHMIVYYANTKELYIVTILHGSMNVDTRLAHLLKKINLH